MLAHSQGGILNAAQLARSLAVDGKTIARYLDLMVDLLLVRTLPPFFINTRKRLVKSPKVYVRDTGLLHNLLSLGDLESLLGHSILGGSWEGFVLENFLDIVSDRTCASFYGTASGAEIDLVLEMPGSKLWAIEIIRGLAPKVEKGLYQACEDLKPAKAFVVYSGDERYSIAKNIEVIGLAQMAKLLREI